MAIQYTIKQIADVTGLDRGTIYNWSKLTKKESHTPRDRFYIALFKNLSNDGNFLEKMAKPEIKEGEK